MRGKLVRNLLTIGIVSFSLTGLCLAVAVKRGVI